MSVRSLLAAILVTVLSAGGSAAESVIRPGERIAIVGNTYADQLRIHGYLETILLQRTAGLAVSVRNLGWGGDMLSARDRPTNFPSEEATLRAHETDVIIACFGMGESFAGQKGLGEFRKNLVAFLESQRGKSYNGKSEVRLVLISPIAQEDLGELTPNRGKRNRELAAYTKAMGEVAAKREVPFVNLYDPTLYLMEDPAARKLTSNGIHLNSYGYWATSRMVADRLALEKEGWRVEIDVDRGTASGAGVEVGGVAKEESDVGFSVKEMRPPRIGPPAGGAIHASLAARRDVLVAKNLRNGSYSLTVDGEHVVTAKSAAWEQGVAIDASPAHREAEAYRAAVNDKNLQFTYSWKALNQVHIVGERKKSNSGRALPAEVIEFKKLADKRDEDLRSGIPLKTRQWRLVRIPDQPSR